jgi:hypothetical protein
MLDINTIIRSLDDDVAETVRGDVVQALLSACADFVEEAVDEAWCAPEVQKALLRWWSDTESAEGCAQCCSEAEITDLLSALARACVEVFAYSALPNDEWYPGAPVDLAMHDRGGAILHLRAYNAAAILCMVAHGERGAAIVQRFDDLKERNLDRIAEMIGERLGKKVRH